MVKISIDTTSSVEVRVGLFFDQQKDIITQPLEHRKAQAVLPLIVSLLEKHALPLSEITAIEVHPGPGSFTGVRVGVAIANALSFALDIPVNNQKHPVEPVYS